MQWCDVADRLELTPVGRYITAGPDDPVTRYSAEYKFLLELVYQLGKESIPENRIKEIVQSRRLKTIGDVEMVTTDLWTMAIGEFQIPPDHLMQVLRKS